MSPPGPHGGALLRGTTLGPGTSDLRHQVPPLPAPHLSVPSVPTRREPPQSAGSCRCHSTECTFYTGKKEGNRGGNQLCAEVVFRQPYTLSPSPNSLLHCLESGVLGEANLSRQDQRTSVFCQLGRESLPVQHHGQRLPLGFQL